MIDVLDIDDLPIVLTGSKRGPFFLIAVSFLFAGIGLHEEWPDFKEALWYIVPAIGLLIFGVMQLRPGASSLTLNEDGFIYRALNSDIVVPWEHVKNINCKDKNFMKVVCFEFIDDAPAYGFSSLGDRFGCDRQLAR